LLVAVLTGQAASLGADAGLLAVLAFALRQGMLQVAAVRRLHGAYGGKLRPSLVATAAGGRLAPSLGAVAVSAAVLLPFAVLGDVPGNEIGHTAAAVTLGGLVTATLWSLLVLPALCFVLVPVAPKRELEPLDIDPLSLPAPPIAVHANGHGNSNGNGNGHVNGNGNGHARALRKQKPDAQTR
jgi:hypothetical protein